MISTSQIIRYNHRLIIYYIISLWVQCWFMAMDWLLNTYNTLLTDVLTSMVYYIYYIICIFSHAN